MDVQHTSRRRFKRIPVDLRAGVTSGNRFTIVHVVSISEGGALLRTSVGLSTGDPVEMQMFIWSDLVTAIGEVIYVNPTDEFSGEICLGVRFTTIALRDVRLIRAFVNNA